MKPQEIDVETALRLIDYSGGDEDLKSLADIQIKGAVALRNMLMNPDVGFAYLADEVGMGKTYIALGVVAMMRYFNPMTRVLYICPSRNVQEKWEREYKAFIRNNVKVSQGRIRTREGRPAAPYISCGNVIDLLHHAGSGYYTDFFIGKDSFSVSLTDDQETWQRKLNELKSLVPAHDWKGIIGSKADVKENYARALNYILPTFDLVVIDEAHNFKHSFESSDRNKVLSGVLGTRDDYMLRIRHALLLSATPYDRDLNQLRNQLKMVGKSELIPEEIDEDTQKIRDYLKRFLVRRLNVLKVNGHELTRNMYRREWRKGVRAEIALETDEQKLVTALVQKKVGEMLTHQSQSASFQTGLLASFESFAESIKSESVRFDGDQSEKEQTDAKDRHVIGHIADNYIASGLGRTLPHPKMDSVVKRLSHAMFSQAKKQVIFVRRVRSVNEIKDKLDDVYSQWISEYTNAVLAKHEPQRKVMESVYRAYLDASKQRDESVLGGEFEVEGTGEQDEPSPPPKNDTFYAWFFRGGTPEEIKAALGDYPSPDAVRKGLTAKGQVVATLLEPNWAWYITQREDVDLSDLLGRDGDKIAELAGKHVSGHLAKDELEIFRACQTAFIEWIIKEPSKEYLRPLFKNIATSHDASPEQVVTCEKLIEQLSIPTIYTELDFSGNNEVIIHQSRLYDHLKSASLSEHDTKEQLKLFDIHKALLSFVLRTGHGIIDIYLARLKQGPMNLSPQSRKQWMSDFVAMLEEQKKAHGFSTYHELIHLAAHLDLIIRNNIPDILDLHKAEYGRFLGRALSPVSPVIGASGETSGRSAQARKFRMPGYPLALVTTDVFQEGEDLHTFCDSVVHYGLSASPVSLEQKTGRVDRVNSMAQRRLQALEQQADDEELIQVTFPYVKQSIEMLQIRDTCKNLNDFILSLYDVAPEKRTYSDSHEVEIGLTQKDEVPELISDFLKSPYIPFVTNRNKHHCVQTINDQEYLRENEVKHVSGLIKDVVDARGAHAENYVYNNSDDYTVPDGKSAIRIISAKASGELLLTLTRMANQFVHKSLDKKEFMRLMFDLSWRTFYRTYAIESSEGFQLYFNSEMLAGGSEITQRKEIERFFERMEIRHNPQDYRKEISEELMSFVKSISEATIIPIDRSGDTKLKSIFDNGQTTLFFEFGGQQVHRTQRVLLYECDGRCVFLSYASAASYCDNLPISEIIKYTWLRNRNIDLVEFVVDPSLALVGRVVHPVADMQWDEFIYCAYTLAVETDNLEYLLSKQDIH